MVYKRIYIIRAKNIIGGTIPAHSFAKISSYDSAPGYYHINIVAPGENNLPLSELVITIDPIESNKVGLVYLGFDGLFLVSTEDDSIMPGDKVGTDNQSWGAIKIADIGDGLNDGQFLVIETWYQKLLIRPRTRESIAIV